MPRHSIENNTAPDKPAARYLADAAAPDPEAIAKLAHQLWRERGRPEGSPEEDWYQAEDLLRTGRAVIASSTLP